LRQFTDETLLSIVKQGMKPTDLMKQAKEASPGASKKGIVHAAVFAVISYADSASARVRDLQNLL
jgi:hypothetical protein